MKSMKIHIFLFIVACFPYAISTNVKYDTYYPINVNALIPATTTPWTVVAQFPQFNRPGIPLAGVYISIGTKGTTQHNTTNNLITNAKGQSLTSFETLVSTQGCCGNIVSLLEAKYELGTQYWNLTGYQWISDVTPVSYSTTRSVTHINPSILALFNHTKGSFINLNIKSSSQLEFKVTENALTSVLVTSVIPPTIDLHSCVIKYYYY